MDPDTLTEEALGAYLNLKSILTARKTHSDDKWTSELTEWSNELITKARSVEGWSFVKEAMLSMCRDLDC